MSIADRMPSVFNISFDRNVEENGLVAKPPAPAKTSCTCRRPAFCATRSTVWCSTRACKTASFRLSVTQSDGYACQGRPQDKHHHQHVALAKRLRLFYMTGGDPTPPRTADVQVFLRIGTDYRIHPSTRRRWCFTQPGARPMKTCGVA
jgi:hypothetical protein